MSKGNDDSKLTKVEIQRQERKERLSSQKGHDGKHKSIHVKKKNRALAPTIIVVLILAVLLWFLNGYGFAERYLNAFSVAGENVKILEYNYYYNDILNSYKNSLTSAGMPEMNLDDPYPYSEEGQESMTWREMIKDQTEKTIKHVKLLSKEARENEFSLDEKDIEQSDKYIQSLEERQGSKSSLNSFLRQTYGKGFTLADFTKIDREQRLALKYQQSKLENIEVSPEDISSYYEEHKDEVDKVNYNIARVRVDSSKYETENRTGSDDSDSASLSVSTETTNTESAGLEESEEKTEASVTEEKSEASSEEISSSSSQESASSSEELSSEASDLSLGTEESSSLAADTKSEAELKAEQEMKEVADRIENGLKAGGNFESLVMQESDAVENAELAADGSSRLKQSSYKYAIYPQTVADWLFDSERKSGDYFRHEEGGTIYIVQFESRSADKRESANILMRSIPSSEFDKLDKELQQSTKEQLVSDFDSQVKDEESFEGFSVDGLTIDSSNEIKAVREGLLSAAVVNAVLADDTKAMDHKLVEEYGNYYLCFVKSRGPLTVYEQGIKSSLQSQRYRENLDKTLEDTELSYNPLAGIFLAK